MRNMFLREKAAGLKNFNKNNVSNVMQVISFSQLTAWGCMPCVRSDYITAEILWIV